MANTVSGDGYVSATDITAGTGGDGDVTITGGTYSVDVLDSGINGAGSGDPAAYGVVTLDAATSVTVQYQGADPNAIFYGGVDVGRTFQNGYTADGSLFVVGGSTLSILNQATEDANGLILGGYNNLRIGRGDGGSGYVLVSGAGSRLIAEGGAARIAIARDEGFGHLRIDNGGFVGVWDLDVGRGNGAGVTRGILEIDGLGSQLIAGADYGFYGTAYAGQNSGIQFGRANFGDPSDANGRGYLYISGGGNMTVINEDGVTDGANVVFGRDRGSIGYFKVDGNGSSLDVTQVGASGDSANAGSVLILGSGGLGEGFVENGGSVNVTGDGAFLSVGQGRAGQSPIAATSSLTVQSGGSVNVDAGIYGNSGVFIGNDSQKGHLTVTGIGSTFDLLGAAYGYGSSVAPFMAVGRNGGTGTVDLLNGGDMIVEGFVNIGRDGGTGTFNVDNATLLLQTNIGTPDAYGAFMQVGRAGGTGTLNITNGGVVTIDGAADEFPGINIGRDSGSVGNVLVSGTGSGLTVTGTNATDAFGAGLIQVGRSNGGDGTLSVLNGGQVVNSATNSATAIGRDAGALGEVTVDGATSLLDAGETLAIGASLNFTNGTVDGRSGGTGLLTISNGASVVGDDTTVGVTGTLDADGSLTGDLDVFGMLRFGGTGIGALGLTGSLLMRNGSSLELNLQGFGPGQVDTLVISGNANFNLNGINLEGSVAPGAINQSGQTATIATVSGTASGGSYTFTEGDAELTLAAGAGALTLEVTGLTVTGTAGNDTINAGSGKDTISSLTGNDTVNAGAGDDLVIVTEGGLGSDRYNGQDGIDTIDFSAATFVASVLNLGTGAASDNGGPVQVMREFEHLTGSQGADSVFGTSGDNILIGEGGNDLLRGFEGNDSLFGGDGDDSLDGRQGNDRMEGGNGLDRIIGGSGSDEMFGGLGDDFLRGEGGIGDIMEGGEGNDRMIGNQGADSMSGGAGNDVIDAGIDDDTVFGGEGSDRIFGRDGADIIDSGTGRDKLDGGGGADIFVFRVGDGVDDIIDWTDGIDKVDFSQHSGFNSLGDVLAVARDVAGRVFIGDAGDPDIIVLRNTSVAALDADDFIFS